MSDCQFKAGETYPIAGGGYCLVVHVEPDGLTPMGGQPYSIVGVYRSPQWDSPATYGYSLDGLAVAPNRRPELDLLSRARAKEDT